LWNAFGDTDDERNFGGNGFFDTGCGERRTGIESTGSNMDSRSQSHGTKIALAFAPVSRIQSATLAKTGLPRCV
jgi:hypothetical protein